jgi:GlpG protein
MRLLATISEQAKAEALVAYLLTQQISTHVEPASPNDQWELWIRDEDRLEVARQELNAFLADPDNAKYQEAVRHAQRILQERRKQRQEAARNVKTGRSVFRGGPTGTSGRVPPVTLTLIILSVLVSFVTNFTNPMEGNAFGRLVIDEMRFVDETDFRISKGDPAASLKNGEIWRVITPIFPHGSPMHLVFNVFAMIYLGKIVESMEGTLRYSLLVLVTAIFSSLLQGLLPSSFFGGPFFVGISGVVYGLFSYLLLKSMLRPEIGVRLSEPSVMIMLGILIVGFTGMLGPLANMAHLGGFLSGGLLAYWDAQQATARGRK